VADRRWGYLDDARQPLLDAFADDGVIRIEYVAGFPEVPLLSVWLCTTTDAQRDALSVHRDRTGMPVERVVREMRVTTPVATTVRTTLLAHGFTEGDLDGLIVVAQSQETVDRDYEGSWFYATR
jgi:hypothetical protein